MAEGILRRVTLGIAQENTYNTAFSAAQYVLPNTELSFEEVVTQVENTAMIGSTTEVNDLYATMRMVNVSMTMKVDENIIPALFRQKFSVVTSTVQSGAVYSHVLSHKNTNTPGSGESFTLFWDDPDRQDVTVAGFRFNTLNIIAEPGDFVRIEAEGVGTYPVSGTVSNSVSATLREFVGRHVALKLADYGGSPASVDTYNVTMNNEFNLAGEADSFLLGSVEKQRNFTTIDRFSFQALMPYSNETIKNEWKNNTAKEGQVVITDTNRTIGSASNPSITIDYPKLKISEWTREGGANDIHKQNVTYLSLKDPVESDAPMKITVVNTVASYS